MADSGFHWGVYPGNESGTIPYGWDGDRKPSGTDVDPWRIVESSTENANYSSTLGDLRFLENSEYVSPVMNRGSASPNLVTVTKNQTCSDGHGIAVQIRGSSATFDQWEASSPEWEDYTTAGETKTWQYIQIKVKQTEFIEVG